MDVDGFDPYEDEYDWRDRLEVMGEQFQEQLKAKGIKRRLPRRPLVGDQYTDFLEKTGKEWREQEKLLDDVEAEEKGVRPFHFEGF